MAKQLGYTALSHLMRINLAACNARLKLDPVPQTISSWYDGENYTDLRLSCKAATKDCSSMNDTYKAIFAANDQEQRLLHIADIKDPSPRAPIASVTSLLAEIRQLPQTLVRHPDEGKDIIQRCEEAAKMLSDMDERRDLLDKAMREEEMGEK